MNGSDQPEFWEERYRAGRTPWYLRGIPPPLHEFLRNKPAGGRALVPGCGSGYEMQAFHDAGWQVTAIDFAPAAVARARTVLGSLGSSVLLADFFIDDFGANFDVIYERTFLCSLPPARWPEFAARVAGLLRPNGNFAGVFFYGEEPEPPPFPLNQVQADALFSRDFALVEDRPVPPEQSLPLYAGGERWQVWSKRELSSAEAKARL